MVNIKLDKKTPPFPRQRQRGRPQKFGRPARLVAMTLPHDVLDWLGTIHPDVGRAVVALYDATRGPQPPVHPVSSTSAEIVEVVNGRGLILVNPALVHGVNGVATIPFGGGRSFLALEPAWTTADLELAVADCLESQTHDERRRSELAAFRVQLRTWRRDRSVRLTTRTIIVVERARTRPAARRRKA